MTNEAGPTTGHLSATVGESGGVATGEAMSVAQIAAQKRAETNRARSLATGFRVGDQVRANTPRSARFHNRTGRVITTNLGEVGVSFTAGNDTDAYFAPAELWHIR